MVDIVDPDRRLHDIYRMRDLSGRLLYVGVTNGGLRRFMEHSKDKTWWREVSTIDVEHVYCSRPVIEAIEREAIRSERPIYNVVHNRTVVAELPPPVAPAEPLDRLRHPMHDRRTPRPERQCSVTKSNGQRCRNSTVLGKANCSSHSHTIEGYVYLLDEIAEAEGGWIFSPMIDLIGARYGALDLPTRERVNDATVNIKISPTYGGHPTKRRAALTMAVILAAQDRMGNRFLRTVRDGHRHFTLEDAQLSLRKWMEVTKEGDARLNALLVSSTAAA